MHLWKSCELKDMHCYSNLAELLLTSQRSERSKTVVMIDTIVSVCLPVCLVWSLWQKTPVCQSVRLLFLTSKNSLISLAITAHGSHLYIKTIFADPLYNAAVLLRCTFVLGEEVGVRIVISMFSMIILFISSGIIISLRHMNCLLFWSIFNRI